AAQVNLRGRNVLGRAGAAGAATRHGQVELAVVRHVDVGRVGADDARPRDDERLGRLVELRPRGAEGVRVLLAGDAVGVLVELVGQGVGGGGGGQGGVAGGRESQRKGVQRGLTDRRPERRREGGSGGQRLGNGQRPGAVGELAVKVIQDHGEGA